MILVWSGSGILILIPMILVYCGADAGTTWLTKDPNYFAQHFLPPFLGSLATAAAVYYTAKFLNDLDQPKAVIDVDTGQEIMVRRINRLFGIPIKYWHYIIAGVGTAVGVANHFWPSRY